MENRDSRTLWVGNLHDNVTEEMLYELFLQTGPIEQVRRPKDRESQKLRNFAFITYKHACSVPYTLFVLDGVSLFGRRLNIKNKTGSDQGNSKAQQNNDTYGLGLLPHPSYGKGVLPADLSDWVKDEPRQRQYERGMSGPPMMPGMGMPPGMMGMRPPMMGMPPMGPMGPMMMGPRGPMPMMMMGPRGGGLNRSNTWHGDVGDLSRGSSRGGGSRDDRRSSRDDDDRRHRDRERKRDRSPPDNRRSDSSSGGRYEEKRGRYDDRDQRGGGRHGNSSGAGSSRGNHGNSMDAVNAQVQHLAQMQMQMLQQQQMHMMPGRQQQQQHDSRQNRRR